MRMDMDNDKLYYQIFLNNCPDILFLLDHEYNVVLYSSKASEYFTNEAKLTGKSIWAVCMDIMDTDNLVKMRTAFAKLEENKKTMYFDIWSHSYKMGINDFLVCISPAVDEESGFSGVVLMLRDNKKWKAAGVSVETPADNMEDQIDNQTQYEPILESYENESEPEKLIVRNNKSDEEIIKQLSELEALDTNFGLKTVANSIPSYIRVLCSFVNMARRDQGKMADYISYNNFGEFKITIHGYQSALINIGAMSLAKLAQELEKATLKHDWDTIEEYYAEFEKGINDFIESLCEILE